MRNFIYSLLISTALLLAGCGNSKQSSSSGAAQGEGSLAEKSMSNDPGKLVSVAHDGQGIVGTVVTVRVTLQDASNNPIPGTLYWGDFSSSRVFGDALTSHIYHTAKTYTIAVKPDGGNRVDVGKITIVPDPKATDSEVYVFNTNVNEWTTEEKKLSMDIGIELQCVNVKDPENVGSISMKCMQGRSERYPAEYYYPPYLYEVGRYLRDGDDPRKMTSLLLHR